MRITFTPPSGELNLKRASSLHLAGLVSLYKLVMKTETIDPIRNRESRFLSSRAHNYSHVTSLRA